MGCFLTVVFGLLALSSPALALCPDPEPRPCYLFHASKAVFIGTVRSEKRVPPRNDEEEGGVLYTLVVRRQFRGVRARTIRVFTANDSARAILDVGKTYVVFASEGDPPYPLQVWCFDAREVKDIEASARALERIRPQKGDATLHGEAWIADSRIPLPGATVRIRGAKSADLTTDKNGRFQAKLPPGHYRITAFAPDGRLMSQSIYNWGLGDPADLVAEPGQCFDLRFVRD